MKKIIQQRQKRQIGNTEIEITMENDNNKTPKYTTDLGLFLFPSVF